MALDGGAGGIGVTDGIGGIGGIGGTKDLLWRMTSFVGVIDLLVIVCLAFSDVLVRFDCSRVSSDEGI